MKNVLKKKFEFINNIVNIRFDKVFNEIKKFIDLSLYIKN